jgi:glycosyltransferase involved in cell wall biosynthesis
VVFVDDGADNTNYGGQEIYELALLKQLDRARYRPSVMVSGYTDRWRSSSPILLDRVRAQGIEIQRPPYPGYTPVLSAAKDIINIARLLRSIGAQVVHIHTCNSFGARRFTLGAWLAGVPARIRTEHFPVSYHGRQGRFTRRLLDLLTNTIVVVSKSNLEEHVRILGRSPKKLHLAYIGPDTSSLAIATDIARAKQRIGMSDNGPIVGVVGRFAEQKGFTYFIEAAAKTLVADQRVRFLIVGDGELRGQLEEQARQLNLGDHIRFTGWQADTAAFIEAMDIAVMPSLYEGFSLVLLDFMAMGKPIVATGVDGNAEAIIDGESGLLVPARDSGALAEAIITLLRDPQRAAQLGSAARERVRTTFSVQRLANDMMDLYDRTLNGPSGKSLRHFARRRWRRGGAGDLCGDGPS